MQAWAVTLTAHLVKTEVTQFMFDGAHCRCAQAVPHPGHELRHTEVWWARTISDAS